MTQIETFEKWATDNLLTYSTDKSNPSIVHIADFGSCYILPIKEKIINDAFNLIVTKAEKQEASPCQYYVFFFGGNLFYSPVGNKKAQLNILKYVGASNIKLDYDIPYLGVHGKYELLNGSRDYENWCEKAAFLGISLLGLCEKHTLAGTLAFQKACKKHNITPIIGETITVEGKDSQYEVKLYVCGEYGWTNLLALNKIINVDHRTVVQEELIKHGEGLVVVFTQTSSLSVSLINKCKGQFYGTYFQFDSVRFQSDKEDKNYLLDLKNYMDNWSTLIDPVLINDSYYLDKDDSRIKKIANNIKETGFHRNSDDQYFKSLDDNYSILRPLFEDKDEFSDFFAECIDNTVNLAETCKFNIDTSKVRLPSFPKKKLNGKDSEEFIFDLIERGWKDKVVDKVENEDEYADRIEEELRIISMGGFIDYFLILWDIVAWCKDNNIIVGPGRGSAAGSLVSYLLGITNIDPIKWGLLFERFLNEGRVKRGMPDIDVDFETMRRSEVKQYMIDTYGENYVTSIGTYQTLQLRACIKDLGREKGLDQKGLNYITSTIDVAAQGDKITWQSLFEQAQETPSLKEFILSNPDLVNDVRLMLGSPKSSGVHAAGVIIVPRTDELGDSRDIYSWMPVKKIDDKLVSEWEGGYLEDAGFLKEDILGLEQLDKIANILHLIKKSNKDMVDIDHIEVNDKQVFEYFREGYCEDVFQFTSPGLKSFSQELLPESLEDLIAAVSLYRPGPMENHMHTDFVKIRRGEKKAEHDYMLEEVTRETSGLMIYQEQIMEACRIIGGFSLEEADKVRKAMGKKIPEQMEEMKKKFFSGAEKKGCDMIEVEKVWNKMELFAKYSFNKSHSTAYSMISYISMWLKVHYPIEFWVTSLQFASDKEINGRIAEIHKIESDVTLSPPEINKSDKDFTCDYKTKTIYWSLSTVKQAGEKAMDYLFEEREAGGDFFSIDDFYDRLCKSKVYGHGKRLTKINKRIFLHFILSGVFDQIEAIFDIKQRYDLIERWAELTGSDIDPKYMQNKNKTHFWTMEQMALTGFGYIDFVQIYKENKVFKDYDLLDSLQFFNDSAVDSEVAVGGILKHFIVRRSKRGPFIELHLLCNDRMIYVTCWNETYEQYREYFEKGIDKIVFVTGKVVFDNWYKYENTLHSQKNTQFKILD